MKVLFCFLGLLALSNALYERKLVSPAEREQEERVIEKLKQIGVAPKQMEDKISIIISNVIHTIPEHLDFLPVDIGVASVMELVGSLNNTNINGLTNYSLDPLQFALLPTKLELGMSFPLLQIDGDYDINGALAKIIPVYGNGAFNLSATNFTAYVNLVLTSRDLHLVVKSLSIMLSVGEVHVSLENFLGGLGEIIGPLLEDVVPDYVNRIFCNYKSNLENFITTALNLILKDMDLNDLIDHISNVTTMKPPTTDGIFA